MSLTDRISNILNSAETHTARSVNSAQVLANWLIGREIIEEEQGGHERSNYGDKLIPELAKKLKKEGLKGYGGTNLRLCRQFHLEFPHFLTGSIGQTLCDQFRLKIDHSVSDQSKTEDSRIDHTVRDQSTTGRFTPNLSWTHYRNLLKVSTSEDQKAIFTSRYQIHLPSEDALTHEIQRELGHTDGSHPEKK